MVAACVNFKRYTLGGRPLALGAAPPFLGAKLTSN